MLLKRTNGLENIVPPYMSYSVFCDQNGQEKKCPMVSSNHSKVTAEVGDSEDNKKVLNRSIWQKEYYILTELQQMGQIPDLLGSCF